MIMKIIIKIFRRLLILTLFFPLLIQAKPLQETTIPLFNIIVKRDQSLLIKQNYTDNLDIKNSDENILKNKTSPLNPYLDFKSNNQRSSSNMIFNFLPEFDEKKYIQDNNMARLNQTSSSPQKRDFMVTLFTINFL